MLPGKLYCASRPCVTSRDDRLAVVESTALLINCSRYISATRILGISIDCDVKGDKASVSGLHNIGSEIVNQALKKGHFLYCLVVGSAWRDAGVRGRYFQ